MSNKWYCQVGKNSDMVVSTRIRLARNLAHYPFVHRLSDEQRAKVTQDVIDAAQQISGLDLKIIELSTCSQRDILAMVERHLISRDFAADARGVLLISENERISIMINEEDHVRIQVMGAGMDLEETYQLADRVDTALDERLHFAFDDRLGYLTQCPTNLGTGMRASLMLHLPLLQEHGAIQQLANTISKLGLTIRGAYGEGTQPQGALFQMSNQVTLGIDEKAAIDNLKGIAEQIMEQERSLRETALQSPVYLDRMWRSLGILKTARLLSNEEAMNLLSNMRVGVAEGVFEDISLETLAMLINDIQPGCLMAQAGTDLPAQKRDIHRAELVRSNL